MDGAPVGKRIHSSSVWIRSRSFRVAQWLTGQGYTAINVAGGMDMWLEAGKPLVSDNGLKPMVL